MSTKALEAPTMLLEESAVTNALCTAFVCKLFISSEWSIQMLPNLKVI